MQDFEAVMRCSWDGFPCDNLRLQLGLHPDSSVSKFQGCWSPWKVCYFSLWNFGKVVKFSKFNHLYLTSSLTSSRSSHSRISQLEHCTQNDKKRECRWTSHTGTRLAMCSCPSEAVLGPTIWAHIQTPHYNTKMPVCPSRWALDGVCDTLHACRFFAD